MSHFHSIDEMVSAQVVSMLDKHFNHPDANTKLKHEIFNEMSEQFRGLSAFYRRVTADKFLTRPKRFNDGSCLVLLNFDLPNTSNAYKLLVNEGHHKLYHFTVFQENSLKLDTTRYVTLSEEQSDEIFRQIDNIRESVGIDNFKIPAIFTLMHVPKEIDGYEYASVPVPDEEESSVEEPHVTETVTLETTDPRGTDPAEQKRRGPTPVKFQSGTNGSGKVIQNGNTTTYFKP